MATILLVDDDVAIMAVLATTLEEAGYSVLRATTVPHATDLLDAQPDLMLLEVHIEGGTGWDLLGYAAAQGVPVLVLTSHAQEEEVVRALEAGAADVLGKPYRTQELLMRIRTRLGLNAPQRAARTPAKRKPKRLDPTEPSDAVFMTQSDEQALVAETAQGQATTPEQIEDIESLPLGERLRAARKLRHQSLVQVNLETRSKLAIWYLQAMEEEKFGLLPRGPLAVQMVREYAEYLGLDGNRAVADFRAQHDVSPLQPPPSLGRPARRGIPGWSWALSGVLLALALLATIVGFTGGWSTASDKLSTFGSNVRQLLGGATVTPTASATPPPPTITSTATAPATATSTQTPTVLPSPTSAPPSATPDPAAPSPTPDPALPPVPTATAGP